MDAAIVEGRAFEAQDLDRAGDVAVIDDLAAARLFPGQRAVGRNVWIGAAAAPPLEIIGVVRHIRHSQVRGEEREVIYRPAPAARTLAVVVRAASGTTAAVVPRAAPDHGRARR